MKTRWSNTTLFIITNKQPYEVMDSFDIGDSVLIKHTIGEMWKIGADSSKTFMRANLLKIYDGANFSYSWTDYHTGAFASEIVYVVRCRMIINEKIDRRFI